MNFDGGVKHPDALTKEILITLTKPRLFDKTVIEETDIFKAAKSKTNISTNKANKANVDISKI